MNKRDFNLLCCDLAGLRPDEQRYFRLVEQHGLAVKDVADLFEVTTSRVDKVLGAARRKYEKCYRSIRW